MLKSAWTLCSTCKIFKIRKHSMLMIDAYGEKSLSGHEVSLDKLRGLAAYPVVTAMNTKMS